MKIVDYLLIFNVCVILFCTAHITKITMRSACFSRIYFTDEWYEAHCQLNVWVNEGKLPAMDWHTQSHHLRLLCGCYNLQRTRKRLAMLKGPNGWAVYNMLLKQRSWWVKIIS